MKLGRIIEKIEHPRRYVVMVPTMNGKPYVDPDRPNSLICPLTALGGTARTRVGARLKARRFERQIEREKAA